MTWQKKHKSTLQPTILILGHWRRINLNMYTPTTAASFLTSMKQVRLRRDGEKWESNESETKLNNSTTNNQPTQLLTTQSPNVDTRPDFRQVLLSPLPTLVSGDFKTGDAVDYQVDRSFLPWCVGGSRRRWWCGRHHSRGQQTAQDFKWLVVRYLV